MHSDHSIIAVLARRNEGNTTPAAEDDCVSKVLSRMWKAHVARRFTDVDVFQALGKKHKATPAINVGRCGITNL